MNYIGTKKVVGKPMNRLEYNHRKGWELPAGENGADEGYLVEYDNGHQSWSPKAVFEDSYRPCDALNFGLAIEALKQGKRITRPSWNGKGMWLIMVGVEHYDVGAKTIGQTNVELAPWIGMMTAQGKFTPWSPAQSDVLADDWQLYGEQLTTSTYRLQIPVQTDASINLYTVCKSAGTIKGDPGLDLTDSIFNAELVKVVNKAGLAFVAHFVKGPMSPPREITINGTLNNEVNFSLHIDKETWNAKLQSTVSGEDLFLVLDVVVGNHNRP